MIKKIIAIAGLAVLLPASSFAYWGINLKGGVSPVNHTDHENEMNYQASHSNYNYWFYEKGPDRCPSAGAELFFEGNGKNRLGLSAGWKAIGLAGPTLREEDSANVLLDLKNSAVAIPVTLYWKHKADNSKVALWLGAGADYMKTKTQWTVVASGDIIDLIQSKIVPHADAGIEWYIFKKVSLGINLGYLFGAKFEELKGTHNGTDVQLYTVPRAIGREILLAGSKPAGAKSYVQDWSGLRGDLALRVYFGGPSK